MQAQLIKHDGTFQGIDPDNGTDFSLQECYHLIGCYMVEVVELFDGRIMILDENGKGRNDWRERINIPATELFKSGRMTRSEREEYFKELKAQGIEVISIPDDSGDSIVGNVIVCEPNQFK